MTENTGNPPDQDLQFPIQWPLTNTRVHGMSSQDVIVTTEDRLHRRLHEHSSAINGSRTWLIPLSILIPVGITLLTATFEDFIFSSAEWRAIFVLVALACVGKLVIDFWAQRKAPTINDLVDTLKETAQGDNPRK